MKLSMSMSSSKSTVRMYLISDPLGVSYVSPSGNVGFSEIKRIETFEPGPQYYHITSHYDTLRMIYGHSLGRICRQITCLRIASLPTRVVGAFSQRGVEVSPFSLQSLWDGRICSQSRCLRTSSDHTLYRPSPPYEGELRPAILRQVREAVLHGRQVPSDVSLP